ncbi:MAG: hypothetical protein ACHBN1_11690 [Heteroscytonema crispum UTEX LB 1556]
MTILQINDDTYPYDCGFGEKGRSIVAIFYTIFSIFDTYTFPQPPEPRGGKKRCGFSSRFIAVGKGDCHMLQRFHVNWY